MSVKIRNAFFYCIGDILRGHVVLWSGGSAVLEVILEFSGLGRGTVVHVVYYTICSR